MMGVLYKKMINVATLGDLLEKYPPDHYIILTFESRGRWKELLNGIEIDAEDVEGILPETLVDYGAILKNYEPVKYSATEVLQILICYYRDKDIMRAIKTVKQKERVTGKYIIHLNETIRRLEDKLGI